jgi:hypothetical protein
MFDFYEDVAKPTLQKLITQHHPTELETKVFDCFRRTSAEKLRLSQVESKGFVEDWDSRRTAFVLLQGIQYMQETRRQAQLLSALYGE